MSQSTSALRTIAIFYTKGEKKASKATGLLQESTAVHAEEEKFIQSLHELVSLSSYK